MEKSATCASEFNFLEPVVGIHFITLIIFNIVSKIKICHAHIDSGFYRELGSHGVKEAGTFVKKKGGGASGPKGAENLKGTNRVVMRPGPVVSTASVWECF